MPYDMKTLALDTTAATSSTILFGAINGQTDTQPIPIPINIVGTYVGNNFGASVANPTGTIGLAAVNGVATTALRSDGAPALSQAIAPTWTGQHIFNLNGAASTPPALLNGTWFTGGSATTTKPQFLIEPSGTTSNAWSTSGTGIGANAASGFTGNLLDLQVAASARFTVSAAGNLTMIANSLIQTGSGDLNVQPAGNLDLGSSGGFAFQIDTAGRFKAVTDNANDIGVNNANRPRNAFLGGALATAVPNTQSGTSYSMSATDSSLIFTNAGAVTLTLQAASSFFGRWLYIKETGAGAVSSASSNVVPLGGGAAGTAITTAAGKFAILQSDGTNWIIMVAN